MGRNEAESMEEDKTVQKTVEESESKKGFISWIKNHKTQLMIAGVGTAAFIAMVLGVKNKESISELLELWRKDLKSGKPLSEKWFNNASLEELEEARKVVHKDYLNPELDMDYRADCHNLLFRFDQAIGKKKMAGKEPDYPVHSEHGWHLPSDD